VQSIQRRPRTSYSFAQAEQCGEHARVGGARVGGTAARVAGARAGARVTNICRHNRSMLGEGLGPQTWITMFLGTGRNLRPVRHTFLGLSLLRGTDRELGPQTSTFFYRELKRKIGRETFFIPLYLFIQTFCGDTVNTGQVGIQYDLLFADLANQIFQTNNRCDDFFSSCARHFCGETLAEPFSERKRSFRLSLNSYSLKVMDEKPDHAGVVAPPPLLMVLCLAVGFLAEHFQHFPIFPADHPLRRPLCFALFGAAVIVFVAAVRELIKHKTHPSPYKATAALVQTGIYRCSRNPIYVGFLLLVVASAACANSAWLLLAAVVLFVLLRFGVVNREEQYLSRRFGEVYEEYRRKVRRWG